MTKKEYSAGSGEFIHVIMTGGTIDAHYDGTKDTVITNEHSVVPKYLNSLNLMEEIHFTEICMKDSRELSEQDFIRVLKNVQKSVHTKIIITIGTYTMPDVARYLKANLERKDQTIIFTGSMVPLEGFSPSDAGFNLGYSLAAVKNSKPGIYVCMNGRLLTPEETLKMVFRGRFASVFEERTK